MAIGSKIKNGILSMKMKFILSLSSIVVVLLIAGVISVMEYRSMSNYVSGMIAEDIGNINAAQKLSDVSNQYNLGILAVIGDETLVKLPDFDASFFVAQCDSLRGTLSPGWLHLADSVEYSYSAFMLTSLELQNVLHSDFIDSRAWYFERLQPRYNRLCSDIGNLSREIYKDLSKNSATFDRGFYRSVIPGIVAVGVGILLVIMLMFFILGDYVNPIGKIISALGSYRSLNRRYTYEFEGDEQIMELNGSIKEIANENLTLRNRLLGRNEFQGDK